MPTSCSTPFALLLTLIKQRSESLYLAPRRLIVGLRLLGAGIARHPQSFRPDHPALMARCCARGCYSPRVMRPICSARSASSPGIQWRYTLSVVAVDVWPSIAATRDGRTPAESSCVAT